mmetsp:Transcript_26246/g.57779  ORF Transcript_26246/g.57779 Transcript_26246/m.57779 type:complete len:228 (-) Transcript_26246:145-828(-)
MAGSGAFGSFFRCRGFAQATRKAAWSFSVLPDSFCAVLRASVTLSSRSPSSRSSEGMQPSARLDRKRTVSPRPGRPGAAFCRASSPKCLWASSHSRQSSRMPGRAEAGRWSLRAASSSRAALARRTKGARSAGRPASSLTEMSSSSSGNVRSAHAAAQHPLSTIRSTSSCEGCQLLLLSSAASAASVAACRFLLKSSSTSGSLRCLFPASTSPSAPSDASLGALVLD